MKKYDIGKALASIGVCVVMLAMIYWKVGCWSIMAAGIVICAALVSIWEGW